MHEKGSPIRQFGAPSICETDFSAMRVGDDRLRRSSEPDADPCANGGAHRHASAGSDRHAIYAVEDSVGG